MQRRKLLVALTHRERLRRLDETARALGVFFNIHRYVPQPAAPPGARSAKADTGVASDRAPILKRHNLIAKPPPLWRIMREARIQHLHWVSAGCIDIPQ